MAKAVQGCAEGVSARTVTVLFQFLISRALGDSELVVREAFIEAGQRMIEVQGEANLGPLLAQFEQCLSRTSTCEFEDHVHQGVVLFLGRLSQFLPKDDPKVLSVVEKLIGALDTPSEPVQKAAAACIPKLCSGIKTQSDGFVEDLKHKVVNGEEVFHRAGAAFGLGALIKGLGITSLKKFDIIATLEAAVTDKSNPGSRHGAVLAYQAP